MRNEGLNYNQPSIHTSLTRRGGVELTYLSKHPLLKIGPFVSVLYIVGKYSEVILPQSYQPAKSKAESTRRLSSYNSKNQCQICRSK